MWFALDFWPNYFSNGWDIAAKDVVAIRAWAELKNVQPTPLDVSLLLRLDIEFRDALAQKRKNKTRSGDRETTVPASNVTAVGALMQGFRARAKAVFGKKEKK